MHVCMSTRRQAGTHTHTHTHTHSLSLSLSLSHTHTTQEEWDGFGIEGLTMNDAVRLVDARHPSYAI